jgi:hypothetical protein
MSRKYLLLFAFLLSFPLWLGAQSFSLEEINENRLYKQKSSMMVLGGWAAGNIILGLSLFPGRSGSDRYFHIMNAGWNAVNLGIATFGYITAVKADPASFDLYQTLAEQRKIQNLLLFNAGLDIGYMVGGAWLIERSKNAESNADRLRGFGQSIILQGAFLFTFDLIAYFAQAAENPKTRALLESLSFNGSSLSFTLQI